MSNTKNLKIVHDETVPDTPDAETAFLVIVTHDGSIKATADLGQPLTVAREANMGDMRRASSELVHEINSNITAGLAAQHVLASLSQMAQNTTPGGLVVP